MQHIETFSEPDMLLHLHDDMIIDHRAAATLALQHHCKGDLERALVWERLAVFLRVSEAYIFDDYAGLNKSLRGETDRLNSPQASIVKAIPQKGIAFGPLWVYK